MKSVKLIVIVATLLAAAHVCRPQVRAQFQNVSIKDLEAQAAREPQNAGLQQKLGWAYFYEARQGDREKLEKAIQTFEKSLALAPAGTGANRGLGLSYFLKTAFLARESASRSDLQTAFEQTLTSFDRALAQTPADPLLLAAHGSATSIYAALNAKPELFKKGTDEMNRAVELEPKAAHGRLFRAFTSINLPPAFRQSSQVVEDFNMLIKYSAGYNEQAEGVLRVLLGDFYAGNKEFEKARSEYAAASDRGMAMEDARRRLRMLEKGDLDATALRQYRNNVLNCTICHKQ